MPYQTTWETPGSMYTRFTGKVTYAEVLAATNELYDDSRSDEVTRVFWDFSEIDGFAVVEKEVEEMVAMDVTASRYLKPMKVGFIINDPALLDLAEKYITGLRALGCP